MEEKKVIEEIMIPAKKGKAFTVKKGSYFKLIDVKGQQVADMIALVSGSEDYFSPAHTRSCLNSIKLEIGDHLFSNRRKPLLKIIEDTVGLHDIVVPCCDVERYQKDYKLEYHENCYDNLVDALKALDITRDPLPEALNVFMNNKVLADGSIVTEEPINKPGDYILFEVLEDLTVAISACPQDLSPCNAYNPTEMKVEILS